MHQYRMRVLLALYALLLGVQPVLAGSKAFWDFAKTAEPVGTTETGLTFESTDDTTDSLLKTFGFNKENSSLTHVKGRAKVEYEIMDFLPGETISVAVKLEIPDFSRGTVHLVIGEPTDRRAQPLVNATFAGSGWSKVVRSVDGEAREEGVTAPKHPGGETELLLKLDTSTGEIEMTANGVPVTTLTDDRLPGAIQSAARLTASAMIVGVGMQPEVEAVYQPSQILTFGVESGTRPKK
jgi:hypothetical protein